MFLLGELANTCTGHRKYKGKTIQEPSIKCRMARPRTCPPKFPCVRSVYLEGRSGMPLD